uniref:Ig-like domain-containing protein n=1 Tax=Neolamprologus brichardi TaxID=32507 RepID=A0A3Q4M0W4_NEOBR
MVLILPYSSGTHCGFVSPSVGDKVTLQCFYEEDAVMSYWYKQSLGQNPKLVSKFYKHEKSGTFYSEFENNSRFSLDTGNGNNHLIISDIQISDSATYYCIGIYVYDFEFSEGVTVSVEGSGINIQTLLHQSEPMVPSETIQPGGSALNCIIHKHTYDGGHRVYWFQDSTESHPGLIYANGVRSDEYEKRPKIQTHTCFYNLPMKSPNLSDTLVENSYEDAGRYTCNTSFSPILKIIFFIAQCSVCESFQGMYA